VESHYLDFPITNKDFDHWETRGTAVHLRDKLVVVPETKHATGMLYSANPNPISKSWLMDFEVNMGNTKRSARGGVGIAMLYLK